MRVALILAAFIAASTQSGCTQAVSVPGPEASIVVGDWEWSTACCSIAGARKTPTTEGYSYVLQFSSDGIVSAFRDNDLVVTTRYTVTRSRPNPLADEITTIEYDTPLPHGPGILSAKRQMVTRLENGTLVLVNLECADCYGEWRLLPRLTGSL